MQALLRRIRQILKDRRTRKFLTRVISSVAAIVVFVTTYALILPAITLEKTAVCGIEAHQHDESCYEERLVCGQEENDGHHHDDSCYSTKLELTCGIQEHQHSEENGCYDADGNLVCQLQEHVHDDSCYEEIRTLTCGMEEYEGHHHTDACYEKVLVCGKEVHTHSDKCYEKDSSTDSAEDGDSAGIPSDSADAGDNENAGETGDTGNSVPGTSDSDDSVSEEQSDSYMPELEPLDIEAVLDSHTDFYYFHAEEGEEVPANSAEITEWKKVDEETVLASTDLVKMYLAYTIPAGSLNATNPTARYRLPDNIHLSDKQIKAINLYENGIAAGYREISAASENDEKDQAEENYKKYLGVEAVEGDRRPDEQLMDGAQEFISAVVRAENVYDEEGLYGEKGACLGQDLIFTFAPYSVEKNQNTYDADRTLISAGEKITGWFACDFKLNQIDWEQEDENKEEDIIQEDTNGEENTDDESIDEDGIGQDDNDNNIENTDTKDNTEKTAKVIFVQEDQEKEIEEIRRVLRMDGEIDDGTSSETMTDTPEETGEDQDDMDDQGDQVFKAGTLTYEGDDYSITLDYGEDAKIPENATLSVREITAETDKEAYEACLVQAGQQVAADDKTSVDQKASRFFDIEILVTETESDGTEKTVKIEPAAPVSVNIRINEKPASQESESDQSEPTVLHFAEEGVEQIDSTVTDSRNNDKEEQKTEIQFEAESFSVYGVVYTVDFHWEVDGKVYDFSIPGGGFVSFEHLVEVLGIASADENTKNEAENAENNVENEDDFDGEVPGADVSDENGTAYEEAIKLNEVEVSEATRKFVADVESVEFSNPELVWVGKVDSAATVGGLKEANGLEVEYSADLTEEQIAEINAQTVEAGDWALISVQPFTSEESLTVTMKNGGQFVVRVTDDQISNYDLLENRQNYVLYIEAGGKYYALDGQGNTVEVPDNNLDVLPNEYLWRFTSQENGSATYNDSSSWVNTSGNNFLDVYYTNKEKPVVAADNTLNNGETWLPIVTLVSQGGGFYFRDLNASQTTVYIPGIGNWPAHQYRFLQADSNTHALKTVAGNRYWSTPFGTAYEGDLYEGAAVIHVYKQGSAYTVKSQSNDETFGHVKYTHDTTNEQTSASHTSIDVLTENSVEKNKTVPGNFTAIPENGYKFTGWEVIHINSWDTCDVTDWGSGATQESVTIQPTVDGNLILKANFAPEKLYPFTVKTNDETMGTVGGGNEQGANVAGQNTFTSISGVVIDGKGWNAYELSAVQKPLHKFVAWELKNANGEVVQTIENDTIPAHFFELTEDGMTLTAIFRKKTETEIDEGDIDTLLGSWKTDMTSDFVGVDKTAHVHDPENRIYEIDLSASSGKWAVENNINLDFITDTSRSMYFPANLEYAKGTEEASSCTKLKSWLNDNGTIGETYYVISSDNTATMYAVHYEDGEWKYRDASYYYYWKGENRTSTPVPDSLSLSKTITGIIYKSRTAPASYQAHEGVPSSLEEYWSRLDYLYKAVMTATETLKAIDPQAAVHLTTFNKQSFNNGWIVKSTDSPLNEQQIFTSSLTGVTPSGGTRQDEGLYTSRTGNDRTGTNGNGPGPGTDEGVGTGADCAFADSSHRHFAILVTDGAPNGAEWGSETNTAYDTIFGQAKRLKDIEDDNHNPLTLMTLGISLNFVNETDRDNLARISSDRSKYAKAANNGGQIVTAIEDLVESMTCKAAMFGNVSDTLDPAFYPVKSDGTPITPGFYTMDGDTYSPTANDTNEYCQWSRNGDSWTVTYYNQTFKWPTRDDNGNITRNGWEHAFYAKVKENFMGGNAIETNSVGSTTFTGTHTILMDGSGNVRLDTKKEVVDNLNQAKPITKSDIPTPHVNVKQLTLTENSTNWKVYVRTEVNPLPQIKALYDNILVQEVVDSSTEHMITNKSAMLFNPPKGTDPETFYLKDVFGDSNTIDWTALTAAVEEGNPPAYVDLPYNNPELNYGHNTGYIRVTLTKEGETANYGDHLASSNLNDLETYVLSAQFIPYTASEMFDDHGLQTDTHDHSYHTTPLQSPGTEQLSGKPSENTHEIELFVRGLGITKTDENFVHGLEGAEFTVYRPATAEEVADSENEIKTFEGGKYIFDRVISVDENGVAFVNGVRSLTPPKTTYYMVETKAPEGYVQRDDPIRVDLEITNEYTLLPVPKGEQPHTQSTKPESGMYNWVEKAVLKMVSDYGIIRTTGSYDPSNPDTVYSHYPEPTSEYEVMYYRISNNPGAELPATGGSGTYLIYLLGITLCGFAGVGFVMKRRRRNAA